MKVQDLNCSNRTKAILLRAGLTTAHQVARTDSKVLLGLNDFGPTNYNELYMALEDWWSSTK